LLKEALILSKSLESQGTYSWITFVKNITSDQNIFNKTSNCKNLKEVKSLTPFIKREFKNKYKIMCENKIKSFNENSKMFLYKKLKLNLEREFYLSYNDSDIRRCFTKIRIRDPNLEIEKGLYFKIPRILRLCKTCNKIEDEEHFILECTINSKMRTDLFAILANENPNYMQFSSEQKLIYLLNPTTAHVKIIGFYIIRSLELRTEVS
jgi:hypothetical protein